MPDGAPSRGVATAGAGQGASARPRSGTDSALGHLAFHRVLEAVAVQAGSVPGREAILALRPHPGEDAARTELARVEAVGEFLAGHPQWQIPTCPDARPALRRLEREGSVLEGGELLDLGRLLRSGRLLREGLERGPAPPLLKDLLVEDLLVLLPMEEALLAALDEEGRFKDSASPELGRLRRRIRGLRASMVKELERWVSTLPERWVVPDASVGIREGRYVVPLRREARGEVGGVVHGESATGATLFVEPPLALQRQAELTGLEQSEERETQRLLAHFSGSVREHRGGLGRSLEAQVCFDTLQARARMAGEWGGSRPELLPPGASELRIVRGRHPLLLLQGEEVVPFDLELAPGERAVVVSGPNTGGKTVFLTAVGLLPALAQSGVIPPVDPGTRLPVFTDFFTDIGDQQSIEHSLSTFSAHLANAREILEGAGPGSLVLLDEAGTGTDPAEGAALAQALVEELVARGSRVILTSHLGALKRMDAPGSGVVNASFQFDSTRIRPTYELVKGRPGRSYGLLMAQRLGIPEAILARARGLLGEGEVQVEELLSRMEERERRMEALEARSRADQVAVARLREELETREARIRQREKELEREGRGEARKYLLDARARVEEVIRDVQAQMADGQALDPEVAREARRAVEVEASRQTPRTRGRGAAAGRGGVGTSIRPGARVRFGPEGTRGRVLELRDDRASVEVGGFRLQLPAAELELLPDTEPERSSGKWVGSAGQLPDTPPSPQVDLRGLRVEELDPELLRAVDQAVVGGLPTLTIIHGKGTGALRGRVAELLRSDPRVAEARPGVPAEGGTGVTVVTFR